MSESTNTNKVQDINIPTIERTNIAFFFPNVSQMFHSTTQKIAQYTD